MKSSLILTLITLTFASSATGNPPSPELLDVREIVYKTVGETKLKLRILEPEEHKKPDKGTAGISFGGGWRSGHRSSMPS